MSRVDERRVRQVQPGTLRAGPVVYWMNRDQRVNDNWALLYAQDLALAARQPLAVALCPDAALTGGSLRQAAFMIRGLQHVEKELERRNIRLWLLDGLPHEMLPPWLEKHRASCLVTDFSPLRAWRTAIEAASRQVGIPVYEVDAHNVVPCWTASGKAEYAAYTLRPRITRLLPEFLTDIPRLKKHPVLWQDTLPAIDWPKSLKAVTRDSRPSEVAWLSAGEKQARKVLRAFLDRDLERYHELRNDPMADVQSQLSPYLHFGQISAQRVALEVQRHDRHLKSQEALLEELIVRRELADNFCHYNPKYHSFDGFPQWARKTLDDHRTDPRAHVYSSEQLENAETHDDLWNAAQMEMVVTGKMHGYMRMYWAKKILEWSVSPENALATALELNDRYELDGHDPNGYVGVAWSIGGVHDRPWFEREIFGKVRYMSRGGCERKFDVRGYINRIQAKVRGYSR